MRNKESKQIKKVYQNTEKHAEKKDNLFSDTEKEKKKRVSFYIPEVIDETMREYCFNNRKTKSEIAEKALEEYLAKKILNND
jgi:predicted GNAT superfamily acetyltransferase